MKWIGWGYYYWTFQSLLLRLDYQALGKRNLFHSASTGFDHEWMTAKKPLWAAGPQPIRVILKSLVTECNGAMGREKFEKMYLSEQWPSPSLTMVKALYVSLNRTALRNSRCGWDITVSTHKSNPLATLFYNFHAYSFGLHMVLWRWEALRPQSLCLIKWIMIQIQKERKIER